MCTGKPTGVFRSVFASDLTRTDLSFVSTGFTELSDRFSGDTAVSLYYTATSQGPGPITGPMTKALAEQTGTPSPVNATNESVHMGNLSTIVTGTSASGASLSASTTSPNIAAQTQGSGFVMAIAGAALVAAM